MREREGNEGFEKQGGGGDTRHFLVALFAQQSHFTFLFSLIFFFRRGINIGLPGFLKRKGRDRALTGPGTGEGSASWYPTKGKGE